MNYLQVIEIIKAMEKNTSYIKLSSTYLTYQIDLLKKNTNP